MKRSHLRLLICGAIVTQFGASCTNALQWVNSAAAIFADLSTLIPPGV